MLGKQDITENLGNQPIARAAQPRLQSLSSNLSNVKALDLETVLRASQAIASEIDLHDLHAKLIDILVEISGAQAGYLLLPDPSQASGDRWQIEAIKTINSERTLVESIPIEAIVENHTYVPTSIVNYVARTQETIILNNVPQTEDFQDDPWIRQCQPKSLICMPLLNQGHITAIVILENNLITDAFTPQRVEMLNLLSTQAAISLVKSRLIQQQSELNRALQAEIADLKLAEKECDRLVAIIQASTDILGISTPHDELEYISMLMRDMTEAQEREAALKRSEMTLQNLVAGTAAVTGEDFFIALVKHMATTLNVKYASVAELVDNCQFRTLAFWANDDFHPPMTYFFLNTPCELTLKNGEFCCNSSLQQFFPEDRDLVTMQADSYIGISLKDSHGNAIGNLCILDTKPLPNIDQIKNILRVFAARATAELQRKAANESLSQINQFLEARVKQRTAQLEAANKELESFCYSVSHDLRAPLRAIDGFSRILQEDYQNVLDSEGSRYLKIVRDNAKRMGELIDDLLNLSRLSRKTLSRRAIAVNSLIKKVLADFEAIIQERSIELVIADLPDCEADFSLLTQVWTNLISNAIKYTGKTEKARIEIGYQVGTDCVIYFIRDNGAGFDMQYADKLFGVFQRMHLEQDFEGTGIGLAIAQRIIQRHGGSIWAEAAIAKGASFYFTIPDRYINQ
ncbi:ATP-binding protein [Pseudanabaena sp. UWO310]|uniref:GAF domain-containing sensor histidine kinase n=1 Tax=Pseudanabaena sp. UWO310 TaxID=2480795 RepID=UPI001CC1F0BB|nr:ATP-binding protein [Pseudanabaena sp. UWO310]